MNGSSYGEKKINVFNNRATVTMNYQITKADITDANNILRIQKLAFEIEATRYVHRDFYSLKQTLEELENQFKNHVILKATQESDFIGSVRAYEENKTCFIGMLAVHPDYHNQGIGTALIKEIENQFTPKRYELFTGSKSDNNIHLYKTLGYTVYRKDTYNCDNFELLYMEKLAQ